MKEFHDYEVENMNGGLVLILYHNEKNKRVKDTFDLSAIVIPYLKKKGWEYV